MPTEASDLVTWRNRGMVLFFCGHEFKPAFHRGWNAGDDLAITADVSLAGARVPWAVRSYNSEYARSRDALDSLIVLANYLVSVSAVIVRWPFSGVDFWCLPSLADERPESRDVSRHFATKVESLGCPPNTETGETWGTPSSRLLFGLVLRAGRI